jgi:LPPG:FO 2-phospho-L-lactate transferase
VLAALQAASVVIVGPSNPAISIAPILSVIGEALAAVPAPVVAVSPVVGGRILKGPTDVFLEFFGVPASAEGVAAFYERRHAGMLDGIVSDEAPQGALPALQIDTLLADAQARARVAERVLAFAESLRS